MKTSPPPEHLPDFDADLEKDSVWSLLDDHAAQRPSPRFLQDTVRRVRLESEADGPLPWWKSLFAPKLLPILGGAAVAGCAAIALLFSFQSDPASPTSTGANLADTKEEQNWDKFEDALADELLTEVAEDPTLLSDEEIVALLF